MINSPLYSALCSSIEYVVNVDPNSTVSLQISVSIYTFIDTLYEMLLLLLSLLWRLIDWFETYMAEGLLFLEVI